MPRPDQQAALPIVLPASDAGTTRIGVLYITSGKVSLETTAPSIFYIDMLPVLGAGSQLDIGQNAVLLNRGTLPNDDPNSVVQQVYAEVVSAYNSPNPGFALGDWKGPGITSSLAAADIVKTGTDRLGWAVGVWDSTDAGIATGQAAGTVLIAPTFLGDANGDGTTDNADYAIWRNNFGLGDDWSQADWNYDQFTDNADFAIWRNYFGVGN